MIPSARRTFIVNHCRSYTSTITPVCGLLWICPAVAMRKISQPLRKIPDHPVPIRERSVR